MAVDFPWALMLHDVNTSGRWTYRCGSGYDASRIHVQLVWTLNQPKWTADIDPGRTRGGWWRWFCIRRCMNTPFLEMIPRLMCITNRKKIYCQHPLWHQVSSIIGRSMGELITAMAMVRWSNFPHNTAADDSSLYFAKWWGMQLSVTGNSPKDSTYINNERPSSTD